MSDLNPHSTAKVAGHPLHPMIVPFPIALFVSALVTDLVYLSSGRPGFADASVWLIGGGLAMAALAAVLGLTDFLGERQIRGMRQAWWHMAINVTVVVLEAVSLYLRSTEGVTAAVVPGGVTLSVLSAALLLVSGWLGGELVYHRRVGVSDGEAERVRAR